MDRPCRGPKQHGSAAKGEGGCKETERLHLIELYGWYSSWSGGVAGAPGRIAPAADVGCLTPSPHDDSRTTRRTIALVCRTDRSEMPNRSLPWEKSLHALRASYRVDPTRGRPDPRRDGADWVRLVRSSSRSPKSDGSRRPERDAVHASPWETLRCHQNNPRRSYCPP